jgi:hypothetical protein
VRKRFVCLDELRWWRIVPDPVSGRMPEPATDRYTIQGLPMDPVSFQHQARSLLLGAAVHVVLLALALSKASGKPPTKRE